MNNPTPQQMRKLGLSLFPLPARSKIPGKGMRWKKYQTKRADDKTFSSWLEQDYDFAIITGKLSSVIVVDTDSPEAEEWARNNLPKTTMMVRTGRKPDGFRGVHRYYGYSPDAARITNKASIHIDGLDLRAEGGYVCAPGAHHRSGVTYDVSEPWTPRLLKNVPPFQAGWIPGLESCAKKQNSEPGSWGIESNNMAKAAAWISKKDNFSEGSRNNEAYKAACNLLDFGLSVSEVVSLLLSWDQGNSPPLGEKEIRRIVASANKSRQAPLYPKGQAPEKKCQADPYKKTTRPKPKKEKNGGGGSPNPLSILLDFIEGNFLIIIWEGRVYLVTMQNQAFPIDSQAAEDEIKHGYFLAKRSLFSDETLKKALGILGAKARKFGPEKPVFRRVGRVDDTYYLDLCRDGKVVVVKNEGWSIQTNPEGVYFLRSGSEVEQLPDPKRGGNVLQAGKFFNLPPSQLKFLLGCLLTMLVRGIEYIVIVLQGESGSGKSFAAECIKNLIDPDRADLRSLPKNEQDWGIACAHSWALAIDNIERLSVAQSNTVCKVSTGAWTSTRTLYSNDAETSLRLGNPVIFTGIDDLLPKSDLMDRSALMDLQIPAKRISKKQMRATFESLRPEVLGGLLDALVVALRELPRTSPPPPDVRMIDALHLMTAAESKGGFPWGKGDIIHAFRRSQGLLTDAGIGGDRVAQAILDLMEYRREWEGTATELLDALDLPGSNTDKRMKPSTFGHRVRAAMPLLRKVGIAVNKRHIRRGTRYQIYSQIQRIEESSVTLSHSRANADNPGNSGVTDNGNRLSHSVTLSQGRLPL